MEALIAMFFAVMIPLFIVVIIMIVSVWKIFTKAGQEGWKSIVPIYNSYVFVMIAGLPWWVFLGFFIPVINFVVIIVVYYHVSQRFGHGMGYAPGMTFLPFIFLPVVAFGSSVYTREPTEGEVATSPLAQPVEGSAPQPQVEVAPGSPAPAA